MAKEIAHDTVDQAPALSPTERQWRATLMFGAPLAIISAPLLLSANLIPLCAFRQLTGHPCPLCGGTHACAALAEGQLLAAWQANPGLLPLLAIAAAHTVQLATEALTGRRVERWRIGERLWLAGVALLLTGWGLRLLGLL